jgi:chromosome segregation ATPase
MKTLTVISFMVWFALVALAPAQEDRSLPDLHAKIIKLEQENHTLRARHDSLSAQLNDAVRAIDKLQKDLVAQHDQQREEVKQYIADRDKAVADTELVQESFAAQRAKLTERLTAIAKSYSDLKKKMATIENQKAAAYRFASCSYQFVKEALTAPDPAMRRWAAERLQTLGPDMKPAGGLLVEALKDQDPQVQQAARTALKKIDPELAAKMGIE